MDFQRVQSIVVSICLSILVLGSMQEPTSTTLSSTTANMNAIDAYVTSQMQDLHIPGLSLGIVQGDQVVHLRGFGRADPTGRVVTPQTPFMLASLSKSFTALAIMQLVEQGKIELDAPVQHYLPWFHVATPGASNRITIRNLLTHTSGFSPYLGGVRPASPDETIEQFVRGLSKIRLTAPVGKQFQYSNANYAVLGLVIQVLSRQSYGTYIQQHIFDKLQMHYSFVSLVEAGKYGLATGYQPIFGVILPTTAPFHIDTQPAGYLISGAEDMTHYLIAQMNHGRFGSTAVLSPAGIDILHTPLVTTGLNEGGVAETEKSYAIGWYVGSLDGVPILSHNGDEINMHTDMMIAPSRDWGLVILTNMGSLVGNLVGAMEQMVQGVMRLLLGLHVSTGSDFTITYVFIDGIALLLTALALWSPGRLLRRQQRLLKRRTTSLLLHLILPLLWEWVLPISLFIGIPLLLGGITWISFVLVFPDIGCWLLAMFLLLFITGLVRCLLAAIQLRAGAARTSPSIPYH